MAGLQPHADDHGHVRSYIAVFVALSLFTVITVAVSRIHASDVMHVTIALLIAVVKASLVAAIFMHLKWERAVNIWFVLALCAVFFTVLMMLPVLTLLDAPPRVEHHGWTG